MSKIEDSASPEVVETQQTGSVIVIPDTAAFGVSLKRNNSQIRKDRADTITRNTFIKYKRKIEDLDEDLFTLVNQQENMLDLAPNHTQSLVPVESFDATAFMEADCKLSLTIRNKRIEANIVRRRCNYLFGTAYPILTVEE